MATYVVRTGGLAGGRGVLVTTSWGEAAAQVAMILRDGAAGTTVSAEVLPHPSAFEGDADLRPPAAGEAPPHLARFAR
jgi:hypothetical protein